MKIAVEGCAHGELELIYDTLRALEKKNNLKIDLLICCGDFQSTRNKDDLMCMATPAKYQQMCSFYKYYSGEKVAPVLTIFIGGNHEASNYLQELPYGGWVAPNIYYLGYAGVINIGGLRIGGISGIYKGVDYMKGHYEKAPYTENSKRSVYHVRNLEVFRLKQLSGKMDIFLSHDWPTDVVKFGNVKQLLKKKPLFKNDIDKGELGSKPNNEILYCLKPTYWFAAHLHCKFNALVPFTDKSYTKFLALDKCLPKRKFLQLFDVPHDTTSKIEINYDLEWLTILHLTNHLLSVKSTTTYMPGHGGSERYNFTPSEEEKKYILLRFGSDLIVPKIYSKVVSAFDPKVNRVNPMQRKAILNSQTVNFCEILGVDDPVSNIYKMEGNIVNMSTDANTSVSFINDTSDESFSFSHSTPIKKFLSLSLPDPILNDSTDIEFRENGSPENRKRSSDFEHEEESINSSVEDSAIEEKCNLNKQVTPELKKLKRRNAQIYQNVE